jgi:hypothetical protein
MADQALYTKTEAHQKFAKDLFNFTWTLIEKQDRSRDDDDTMVHAAHASRFHWGKVGKPEQILCGEWQIARVYAILGRGEQSLYHAQRSLDKCREHGIGDFYLASAYEGLARASRVLGRSEDADRYLVMGREACKAIAADDDREIVENDLASLA